MVGTINSTMIRIYAARSVGVVTQLFELESRIHWQQSPANSTAIVGNHNLQSNEQHGADRT